jgi:enamine deaminase RidA (YjgF/YER057c/UK114 family)
MDPAREDGGATGYHMRRKHFTELRPMAAEIRIFNPDTLGKPLGQYSQIARVKNASELAFIAGQLPLEAQTVAAL